MGGWWGGGAKGGVAWNEAAGGGGEGAAGSPVPSLTPEPAYAYTTEDKPAWLLEKEASAMEAGEMDGDTVTIDDAG